MPIVSSNKALRDMVVAGNDQEFADHLAIRPMMDAASQYRSAQADPARPPFDIVGILQTNPSAIDLAGVGKTDWGTHVPSGKTVLLVDATAYPDVLTLRPKDRMTAPERIGSPDYEIELIDPTSRPRVFILLTRI